MINNLLVSDPITKFRAKNALSEWRFGKIILIYKGSDVHSIILTFLFPLLNLTNPNYIKALVFSFNSIFSPSFTLVVII